MGTALALEERSFCLSAKRRFGSSSNSARLAHAGQLHLGVAVRSGLVDQIIGDSIQRQFRGHLAEIGFGIFALLVELDPTLPEFLLYGSQISGQFGTV